MTSSTFSLPFTCPNSRGLDGEQLKEEKQRSEYPGMGRKGPGCGRKVTINGIGRDYQCRQRTCPVCSGLCLGRESCAIHYPGPHRGGAWAHRTALRTRRKLERWMTECGIFALHHVIVSVPPERFAEEDDHGYVIREIRRHALEEVRLHPWGRYGGIAVVHLYRDRSEENAGQWGPHMHVVCTGAKIDYLKAKKDGVFVKVVGNRLRGSPFTTYRGERLLRLITYLLDHVAIVPRIPTVMPFGEARRAPSGRTKRATTKPVHDPHHRADEARPEDAEGTSDEVL